MIILVANVFSHSISCLLLLFLVSFAVQKFLSLIRYHLFIFIFISFALGNKSKIYTIYVKDCSFFSSRSLEHRFSQMMLVCKCSWITWKNLLCQVLLDVLNLLRLREWNSICFFFSLLFTYSVEINRDLCRRFLY